MFSCFFYMASPPTPRKSAFFRKHYMIIHVTDIGIALKYVHYGENIFKIVRLYENLLFSCMRITKQNQRVKFLEESKDYITCKIVKYFTKHRRQFKKNVLTDEIQLLKNILLHHFPLFQPLTNHVVHQCYLSEFDATA